MYLYNVYSHTTAILFMNALCTVTPYLYYSALLYWSVSVPNLSLVPLP